MAAAAAAAASDARRCEARRLAVPPFLPPPPVAVGIAGIAGVDIESGVVTGRRNELEAWRPGV